jgi:hypothetical protein
VAKSPIQLPKIENCFKGTGPLLDLSTSNGAIRIVQL